MARLPPAGIGFQCLYEYEGRLAEVIASLGLKPLDEEAERRFRQRVGFAMAKWCEPYAGVDARELAGSLNQLAKHLDAIDPLIAAMQIGIHKEQDIEGAARLASALGEVHTIGSFEAAQAFTSAFRDDAHTIARAARTAASELRAMKGQGGRPGNEWYDGFVQVVADICAENGIAVKPVNSRKTDEPSGRFFEVAQGLEHILLPTMRSPSPHALAKRLNQSLHRIRAGD